MKQQVNSGRKEVRPPMPQMMIEGPLSWRVREVAMRCARGALISGINKRQLTRAVRPVGASGPEGSKPAPTLGALPLSTVVPAESLYK